MNVFGKYSRSLHLPLFAASIVAIISTVCFPQAALAQQLSFRAYSQADGLSNAVVTCLAQDPTGYVLSCGEHGLHAYDGRRFLNLGPDQGLPEGGVVYDLAFSQSRRVILRYLHRIFVSQNALSLTHAPGDLKFDAVSPGLIELDNTQSGQLASWRDGAIFIGSNKLWYLDLKDASSKPTLRPLAGVLDQPEPNISNTSALSVDKDTVWFTRMDGHICGISWKSTRCFGGKDGLPSLRWLSLKTSPDGHLFARSDLVLADIDLRKRQIKLSNLPFQKTGMLINSRRILLDFTPSGQLLTQSEDGIMIRQNSVWKNLGIQNGLPDAPIGSVLIDNQGCLWLGLIGSGVLKAAGYEAWENWDQHDIQTKGLIWQIARQKDGSLWVATDGGVSSLGSGVEPPPQTQHFPEPSYAVVTDRFNRIWHSMGASGVLATEEKSGNSRYFKLPAVNQILHGINDQLWFVTEGGVFLLHNTAVLQRGPSPVAGLLTRVIAASLAVDGSLWLLSPEGLIHRYDDGRTIRPKFAWSHKDFDPLVIATQLPNMIWIGGAGGGLYRLTMSGDHVESSKEFGSDEIRSNSVVSLAVDKRGWVWAGTDSGLSVFNGLRWISATTDDGLIWDDLDQNSILADDDGSMWFGTSHGLSHLLKPDRLFRQYKLQPVITSVVVDGRSYPGRAVTYTRQPLLLSFGVLDAPSDSVVRFRYRLDGVDQAWADTSVGFARYPILPPGHHRFTVIAYDPLKHQISVPISMVLRMQVPVWTRWPFILAYLSLLVGSLYGLIRLRVSLLLRQKRTLQQEVHRQTRRIRDAQAALFLQATQDGLTKLLTRSEIQRRLDDLLDSVDDKSNITIALLDIDHFKRINDAHGHLAGDDVLRELGKRLKDVMHPDEFAGRYGGEEILLVLQSKPESGVLRIHDLKSVAFDHVYTVGTYMIDVTCSIGVTKVLPQDDWVSLIARADRALYNAKHGGRNKIIEASNATD